MKNRMNQFYIKWSFEIKFIACVLLIGSIWFLLNLLMYLELLRALK